VDLAVRRAAEEWPAGASGSSAPDANRSGAGDGTRAG